MLAAGIAALLANLAFLRQGDTRVEVAVAARPLEAGAAVTAGDLSPAGIYADAGLLGSLLMWDQVASVDGWIVAGRIGEGDLVSRSDLLEAAAPGGLKAMSVPVEAAHAAGGQIVAGDRVDVIGVEDGAASLLVTDASVIRVSDEPSGGLGGAGPSFVVLAVDTAQSLRLAEAMHSGNIEVVRSTGAAEASP
jgi:Flp pilus assembly protein CpaB